MGLLGAFVCNRWNGDFIQTLALVGYYFSPNYIWLFGSMILSDFVMIWMHYRRIKLIVDTQRQTLIWWAILHLSAGILLATYYN